MLKFACRKSRYWSTGDDVAELIDRREASHAFEVVKIHVRANVHVLRVIWHLVVPRSPGAGLETGEHKASSALHHEYVFSDLGHVPAME